MSLPVYRNRSVTGIFGAGESGKTSFAIRYLLNARHVSCRFIFDPDGPPDSYAARLKLKPCGTPLEMEVGIRQGWCCYDPEPIYGFDTEAALKSFCVVALEFSAALPGRKLIVIDEIWRHISPRQIPGELLEVIKNGRKVGLQLVFLSHEPREVNETFLAEATEIVCFRLKGLNSIGKLDDYSFPFKDELPNLPKGHFIGWNALSGGVRRGKLF